MDSAATFDRAGSLGIEEEYYVVDETGAPTAGTDELVHESTPPDVLTDRLDHELFKCVIEAQTPTLSGLDEAEGALREMRGALLDHARGHGFEIAAAGLHPGAKWRELEHAQKPRYRRQLDRIQYPQHRNTTAGLHVHVGVDDPDAAMWIANECRWYLPLLLALSANSPYWCGFDTGLASARANVFENLPNTGIPGAFLSYDAFRTFESRMIETEAITDRGEIWWDVRPHSELGTVEIRTPDAQADPDRVLAMVRYVHALVEALRAQYRAAEAPWRPYRDRTVLPNGWAAGGERVIGAVRRELLVENKWRALRYGRSASLLVPGGGVRDVDALAHSEADRLNVPAIAELAASESGAGAQRRHAADGVEALYTSLALQR